MVWAVGRQLGRIGLGALGGCLLVFFIFTVLASLKSKRQEAGTIKLSAVAGEEKRPIVPPAGAAVNPTASVASTNDAATAQPLSAIEQLLTLRPGHVSALEAVELVRRVKLNATDFEDAVGKLIASTNLHERLLGIYLALESSGPSTELLNRAATDASPYVPAEIADWLYANGRFDEWNRYLATTFSGMTADQFAVVLANLDTRPIRLDVPAAMSLLGLGRGLENYVTELFRRSTGSVIAAQEQIGSANISEIQKENLLRLLHEANPPEYGAILRQIVAATQDDRPLRWQAIWNLGQTAEDGASQLFISNWIAQHPQDPLRSKLEEAAASVATRMASPTSQLALLEQRLGEMSAVGTDSESARMSLLAHYVSAAVREGHPPNQSLLEQGRAGVASLQNTDRPARRLLADIDYLTWRTRQ